MDTKSKKQKRLAFHKESLVVLTPQTLAAVHGGNTEAGGVKTQCTIITLICPVTSGNASGFAEE